VGIEGAILTSAWGWYGQMHVTDGELYHLLDE
jgi:hypothetical protein